MRQPGIGMKIEREALEDKLDSAGIFVENLIEGTSGARAKGALKVGVLGNRHGRIWRTPDRSIRRRQLNPLRYPLRFFDARRARTRRSLSLLLKSIEGLGAFQPPSLHKESGSSSYA